MRWAVKVVYADGTEGYLNRGPIGTGPVATFVARSRAEEQAEFMREGMDGDPDIQSINVVRAPSRVTRHRDPVGKGEDG